MAPKLIKSPFIIEENFITVEKCEEIILNLNHKLPNRDSKNNPIRTSYTNQLAEIRLMPQIDEFLGEAETHYNFKTINVTPFDFQWFPEGYNSEPPKPDNGMYFNGKWTKSKDIDFTCIIFLATAEDSSVSDTMMQSFGGKMEFFNHKLTIRSKAGTMLMYPANDHFLNTFTDVVLGNMNIIRFHITAQTPFVYKPEHFPGDYRTWFA